MHGDAGFRPTRTDANKKRPQQKRRQLRQGATSTGYGAARYVRARCPLPSSATTSHGRGGLTNARWQRPSLATRNYLHHAHPSLGFGDGCVSATATTTAVDASSSCRLVSPLGGLRVSFVQATFFFSSEQPALRNVANTFFTPAVAQEESIPPPPPV